MSCRTKISLRRMTYGSRIFDVRFFWTVASIDPLVVLYHTQQHCLRIGHAIYDESNFSNSTKAYLTTHTFGSVETKATWDEFREFIERHAYDMTAIRNSLIGSSPSTTRAATTPSTPSMPYDEIFLGTSKTK